MEPNWGPSGRDVYERTYRRVKPNGELETWVDTVDRVVKGNLELVYGDDWTQWPREVWDEHNDLIDYIGSMKIIPAGRHLWASGVPGRQYLFNCHVAGWEKEWFAEHFQFTFLRLMEGGGVGSNYATKYLKPYGAPKRFLNVHIVCESEHPDYAKLKDADVLSWRDESSGWIVHDSREGWANALTKLLDAFMDERSFDRSSLVFNLSRIRPEGAPLKTFGGSASGPLPLARMLLEVAEVLNRNITLGREYVTPLEAMEIDHAIARCVVAGGNRRSARMSIVPWDDPHIFEFIACKRDPEKHWTTNISVEVDDRFIELVREYEPGGDPRWSKLDAQIVHAHSVLGTIAAGMLANGEPGIWNSTLSNKGEPRPVVATNPCGEIVLMPWENCNLGHINMDAFAPKAKGEQPDYVGMAHAHRLMTRFLVRATSGDVSSDKQARVLAENRRIGVGHFGVQGYLAKCGIKYSEAPDNELFEVLLESAQIAVRDEARRYAYQLRIPEPVKVTTVAPTGTIAKLAGRTEGIHPIYSRHFIRRIRFSTVDPSQAKKLEEYREQGYKVEQCLYADNTMVVEIPTKDSLVAEVEALGLPTSLVESADEIPLDRMLAFQAMYQRVYADNAVSFTANFPQGELTEVELAEALTRWLPHLKGTTVMPDGTRLQAPYERISREEYEALSTPKSVADSVDVECSSGACPIR